MKRAEAASREAKPSPLYTSKAAEKIKREVIARLGRDLDGAFRVNNRLDRAS